MPEKTNLLLPNDEFSIQQVDRLVDIVKKIQKSLKNKINESCKEVGLTVPQYMVTMHLIYMPKITLNELSEHLHLTPSTVSGIVNRLVNQGIVIRETPKENRRIVKLSVSEDYIKEHNLMGLKQKLFLEIVDGVNPEEIEKIIYGLETFYALLNKKR